MPQADKNKWTADAMTAVANAATEQVRVQSLDRGTLIPVWRDGRVVYLDPHDTGPRNGDDVISTDDLSSQAALF